MEHVSDSSMEDQCSLDQFPKAKFWDKFDIYEWEGFWYEQNILKASMNFSLQFDARDDDVILASTPKTGTTWLKSLCLSIIHGCGSRKWQIRQDGYDEDEDDDVLKSGSPHVHVPTIESMLSTPNPYPVIAGYPSPRLLHTHLPYRILSNSSVVNCPGCKIIYIARNAKDTFVSWWHFNNEIMDAQIPIERAFETFCGWVYLHGPFFEHVLEYWLASLRMPERVIFLRFEELKKNLRHEVKRLAVFLGRPLEEESEVDQVLERCSIERLKNLEVNKSGSNPWHGLPNSSFFRVGVVGDSKNYLTPEMEDRLDQMSREKLKGAGLDLN